MGRNKTKDDLELNCHQDSELDYVAGLYEDKIIVKAFLIGSCLNKSIKYLTHMEVYKIIEKELGFPIPAHKP